MSVPVFALILFVVVHLIRVPHIDNKTNRTVSSVDLRIDNQIDIDTYVYISYIIDVESCSSCIDVYCMQRCISYATKHIIPSRT